MKKGTKKIKDCKTHSGYRLRSDKLQSDMELSISFSGALNKRYNDSKLCEAVNKQLDKTFPITQQVKNRKVI